MFGNASMAADSESTSPMVIFHLQVVQATRVALKNISYLIQQSNAKHDEGPHYNFFPSTFFCMM